jgi:hypothetical protein
MAAKDQAYAEKTTDNHGHDPSSFMAHARGRQFSVDPEDQAIIAADQNQLHKNVRLLSKASCNGYHHHEHRLIMLYSSRADTCR